MGADDYIVKPFSPGRIIISVRNTLEKRRLFRKNFASQADLKKLVAEQTAKIKQSHAFAMQQEKLAAIGQLAAGVAHEINNPVGFITSNLNTLSKYFARYIAYIEFVSDHFDTMPNTVKADLKTQYKNQKLDFLCEDTLTLIEECLDGSERIKSIVQGLKGFARMEDEASQLADINQCIEKAINIAWNEIKYKATLEQDFGELPQIRCFPQQLSQVFMNLLVNAAHAIDGGGKISVSTRFKDGAIRVSVTDTGCGIAPQNQSKIFEPFFTTKEQGKGTGLGMSIAYEIIAQHNGQIWFASEVGQGTTFVIQLPV